MRILLINPWDTDVLPPPSIGYLQAAIKDKCKDVQVDARDLNEAYRLLERNTYDLVGVTFHSFSVRYAKEIRKRFKGRLICGGHHPTALPEQMLLLGYDQVVLGEGENAIIDIINGNENRVIYPEDCHNKYFKSIDDIPFPDYTGLSYHGRFGVNIISSRGCCFSCNFCASSFFWGHKYKMRSAENVIKEIAQRKREGFNTWIFEDDNFTAHKKRVHEICSTLDGSLLWQCQGRAEDLTEDLCTELYNAGCRRMYLGIESFSQATLDRCNKNTTVAKMVRGIETAERIGIKTICLFIVGLPDDTLADIQETHRVRKSIKMSEFGVNIAWVLPGTEIHAKAKEKGFDDNIYLTHGAPFYTYEQSMETLNKWKELI